VTQKVNRKTDKALNRGSTIGFGTSDEIAKAVLFLAFDNSSPNRHRVFRRLRLGLGITGAHALNEERDTKCDLLRKNLQAFGERDAGSGSLPYR